MEIIEPLKSDKTTQQLLSHLSEELKCPLCLELFSDPRLLLCSHTFCSSCLDELMKRAKYNIITCPLCRHVTPVQNSDPTSLKRNLHLSNIISLINSRTEKTQKNSFSGTERELNYTKEQLQDLINFAEFNFEETRLPSIFRDWVQSLWFAPASLRSNAVFNNDARKIWCPFWLFDLTTKTHYSAQVCRKIEKQETWSREEGETETQHKNQIICGASRLKIRKLFEGFHDWQLHKIHFYDQKPKHNPLSERAGHSSTSLNQGSSLMDASSVDDALHFFKSIVTGFSSSNLPTQTPLVDDSSLSVVSSLNIPTTTPPPESTLLMDPPLDWDQCWSQWKNLPQLRSDEERAAREKLMNQENVTDLIDLKFHIEYSTNPRLVYLPVYLSSFTFENGTYMFAVNGQTGQVSADRPYGLGQLGELWRFGFDFASYLLDSIFVSD